MPINTGLADISNDLLLTAVVIYALAMVAYACDFAFGRKKVPALRAAKVPALVGAGQASNEAALVGAKPAASAGGTPPAERSAPRPRPAARWQRPAPRRPAMPLAPARHSASARACSTGTAWDGG